LNLSGQSGCPFPETHVKRKDVKRDALPIAAAITFHVLRFTGILPGELLQV
jgi:hypothetical protein